VDARLIGVVPGPAEGRTRVPGMTTWEFAASGPQRSHRPDVVFQRRNPMPVREGPAQPPPPPREDPYPAEKARGGKIILRKRWQRVIFLSGLVGAVLLVLILQFAALLG
jgi:hypothetical protein